MSDRELKLAIAGMARSAPNDFQKFLAAYRAYNEEILNQLVSSPPEALQIAQGRAKHCREFLRIAESSLADAEQIAKRAK